LNRSLPRTLVHSLLWTDSSIAYVSGRGEHFSEAGHLLVPAAVDDVSAFGWNFGQHPFVRRVVDFEHDGYFELVLGGDIYAADGTLVASAGFDDIITPAVAFVDANGDGRLDIATGQGIFDATGRVLCEVDRETVRGPLAGSASPVVWRDDGEVELLVHPYHDGKEVGAGPTRIQGLACQVRAEVDLTWDGRTDVWEGASPVSAWSVGSDGEPALLARVRGNGRDPYNVHLFDRNLGHLRPLFHALGHDGILFDINGDGYPEWIIAVVDDQHSTSPVWTLLAVDLRDGSTHVMNEASLATRQCRVTDADGDRHAELYCFEEVDDVHYLVAYEGDAHFEHVEVWRLDVDAERPVGDAGDPLGVRA
jgi:hypothetical protein